MRPFTPSTRSCASTIVQISAVPGSEPGYGYRLPPYGTTVGPYALPVPGFVPGLFTCHAHDTELRVHDRPDLGRAHWVVERRGIPARSNRLFQSPCFALDPAGTR